MTENKKILPGHLAMFMATMMWGAMSPIAKGIMGEGALDGLSLSILRIGGGALLFFLASFLPERFTGDSRVEKKDLITLFLASILMISANQGLFIMGIQYTSPVDTSVMCTLTPVFTLILAAIFINQPITPLKVTGVVLGLTGALIMAFSAEGEEIAPNPLLGNSLCMIAQICAAVYYVFFLKVIDKYPPFTIMKWMFLFSAFTYIPAMLPFSNFDFQEFGFYDWSSLAYIIVFPTFLAYLIIPFSQKLLKPTVISSYAYLQPVVSAVLSAIMGFALFDFNRVIATILIFTGVFLVSFSTVRRKTQLST